MSAVTRSKKVEKSRKKSQNEKDCTVPASVLVFDKVSSTDVSAGCVTDGSGDIGLRELVAFVDMCGDWAVVVWRLGCRCLLRILCCCLM